jgi:hypothetical protein
MERGECLVIRLKACGNQVCHTVHQSISIQMEAMATQSRAFEQTKTAIKAHSVRMLHIFS